MNIDVSIQDRLQAFEQKLRTTIAEAAFDERLSEAISYMLLNSGKRFRPRLIYSINDDLGGAVNDVHFIAAATECIHVASLIHDDLPALDNDDFRRGRPTCHKIFGEAVAVLAGDALFGMAFDLLSQCAPERGARATKFLSRALMGLCAGQSEDLLNLKLDTELISMFAKKTGCLIGAAAALGALCSGKSEDQQNKYYDWGVQLGIAFQVVDDYRDRFGTASERGRPESSDQRNAKVGLFADKSPQQIADICRARIAQVIESYGIISPGNAGNSALVQLIRQQFCGILA